LFFRMLTPPFPLFSPSFSSLHSSLWHDMEKSEIDVMPLVIFSLGHGFMCMYEFMCVYSRLSIFAGFAFIDSTNWDSKALGKTEHIQSFILCLCSINYKV
jgi:hypothetical protein